MCTSTSLKLATAIIFQSGRQFFKASSAHLVPPEQPPSLSASPFLLSASPFLRGIRASLGVRKPKRIRGAKIHFLFKIE
jgi:hypothetical protein